MNESLGNKLDDDVLNDYNHIKEFRKTVRQGYDPLNANLVDSYFPVEKHESSALKNSGHISKVTNNTKDEGHVNKVDDEKYALYKKLKGRLKVDEGKSGSAIYVDNRVFIYGGGTKDKNDVLPGKLISMPKEDSLTGSSKSDIEDNEVNIASGANKVIVMMKQPITRIVSVKDDEMKNEIIPIENNPVRKMDIQEESKPGMSNSSNENPDKDEKLMEKLSSTEESTSHDKQTILSEGGSEHMDLSEKQINFQRKEKPKFTSIPNPYNFIIPETKKFSNSNKLESDASTPKNIESERNAGHLAGNKANIASNEDDYLSKIKTPILAVVGSDKDSDIKSEISSSGAHGIHETSISNYEAISNENANVLKEVINKDKGLPLTLTEIKNVTQNETHSAKNASIEEQVTQTPVVEDDLYRKDLHQRQPTSPPTEKKPTGKRSETTPIIVYFSQDKNKDANEKAPDIAHLKSIIEKQKASPTETSTSNYKSTSKLTKTDSSEGTSLGEEKEKDGDNKNYQNLSKAESNLLNADERSSVLRANYLSNTSEDDVERSAMPTPKKTGTVTGAKRDKYASPINQENLPGAEDNINVEEVPEMFDLTNIHTPLQPITHKMQDLISQTQAGMGNIPGLTNETKEDENNNSTQNGTKAAITRETIPQHYIRKEEPSHKFINAEKLPFLEKRFHIAKHNPKNGLKKKGFRINNEAASKRRKRFRIFGRNWNKKERIGRIEKVIESAFTRSLRSVSDKPNLKPIVIRSNSNHHSWHIRRKRDISPIGRVHYINKLLSHAARKYMSDISSSKGYHASNQYLTNRRVHRSYRRGINQLQRPYTSDMIAHKMKRREDEPDDLMLFHYRSTIPRSGRGEINHVVRNRKVHKSTVSNRRKDSQNKVPPPVYQNMMNAQLLQDIVDANRNSDINQMRSFHVPINGESIITMPELHILNLINRSLNTVFNIHSSQLGGTRINSLARYPITKKQIIKIIESIEKLHTQKKGNTTSMLDFSKISEMALATFQKFLSRHNFSASSIHEEVFPEPKYELDRHSNMLNERSRKNISERLQLFGGSRPRTFRNFVLKETPGVEKAGEAKAKVNKVEDKGSKKDNVQKIVISRKYLINQNETFERGLLRKRELIPSRVGALQPSNLKPMPPVGHDPDEDPFQAVAAADISKSNDSKQVNMANNENDKAAAGNETSFKAAAGNEMSFKGAGNETSFKGAGNETSFKGAGNETSFKGAGNETSFNAAGNETSLKYDDKTNSKGNASQLIEKTDSKVNSSTPSQFNGESANHNASISSDHEAAKVNSSQDTQYDGKENSKLNSSISSQYNEQLDTKHNASETSQHEEQQNANLNSSKHMAYEEQANSKVNASSSENPNSKLNSSETSEYNENSKLNSSMSLQHEKENAKVNSSTSSQNEEKMHSNSNNSANIEHEEMLPFQSNSSVAKLNSSASLHNDEKLDSKTNSTSAMLNVESPHSQLNATNSSIHDEHSATLSENKGGERPGLNSTTSSLAEDKGESKLNATKIDAGISKQNETKKATKDTKANEQPENDQQQEQESPPVGPDGKPHADSGPQEHKVWKAQAEAPQDNYNESAPDVGESGKHEVGSAHITAVLKNDKELHELKTNNKVIDTTFEAGLTEEERKAAKEASNKKAANRKEEDNKKVANIKETNEISNSSIKVDDDKKGASIKEKDSNDTVKVKEEENKKAVGIKEGNDEVASANEGSEAKGAGVKEETTNDTASVKEENNMNAPSIKEEENKNAAENKSENAGAVFNGDTNSKTQEVISGNNIYHQTHEIFSIRNQNDTHPANMVISSEASFGNKVNFTKVQIDIKPIIKLASNESNSPVTGDAREAKEMREIKENIEKIVKQQSTNSKYPHLKLPTKNGEYIAPMDIFDDLGGSQPTKTSVKHKIDEVQTNKKTKQENVEAVSQNKPTKGMTTDTQTKKKDEEPKVENDNEINPNMVPTKPIATTTPKRKQRTPKIGKIEHKKINEEEFKNIVDSTPTESSGKKPPTEKPKHATVPVIANPVQDEAKILKENPATLTENKGGEPPGLNWTVVQELLKDAHVKEPIKSNTATEETENLPLLANTSNGKSVPLIPIPMDSPLGKLLYPALGQRDTAPPQTDLNINNLTPNFAAAGDELDLSSILFEPTQKSLSQRKNNRNVLSKLLQGTTYSEDPLEIQRSSASRKQVVLLPDKRGQINTKSNYLSELGKVNKQPKTPITFDSIKLNTNKDKGGTDLPPELTARLNIPLITNNNNFLTPGETDKTDGQIHITVQNKNGHLVLIPDQKEAFQRQMVPQSIKLDLLYKVSRMQKKDYISSGKNSKRPNKNIDYIYGTTKDGKITGIITPKT